jgi:hypothetical protein
MESTSVADRFVGVDISKSWVDVCPRPEWNRVPLPHG